MDLSKASQVKPSIRDQLLQIASNYHRTANHDAPVYVKYHVFQAAVAINKRLNGLAASRLNPRILNAGTTFAKLAADRIFP